MKTIYNIAKAELQNLFFSPIAWLIIIIFTFQVSSVFAGVIEGLVKSRSLEYSLRSLTSAVYGGWGGIFAAVQKYLYLYIPLLTMNLMSREFGSGSIKLLYAAPITNTQIILGKYLSMMIYSLILLSIVGLYVIYGAFTIENVDLPQILAGMLGLYFLMCTYSAIGLFMSSLTSYQVVAAVGTLTILALLNYVKGWWQDVEFVRDLTYWFAITGRSSKFLMGLICSEDVIYFFAVISLFISLTIIRLKTIRQKRARLITWGKYLGVCVIVFSVGYLSSRPMLMNYYDATHNKVNTLTQNSQDIISRLEGGLTITTYTNLLDENFWMAMPERINDDLKLFEQYIRFKPEIKMEYVYYYDSVFNPSFDKRFPNLTLKEKADKMIEINNYNPKMFLTPEQIRAKIDLSEEGNRFVRVLERDNGKKTYLRVFNDNMKFPTETEISAALKRLVMDLPVVGFLSGHEERNTTNIGDRDYSMITQVRNFRHSLINQGFDFENTTLEKEVPERITILVIAEMKIALTPEEQVNLDKYIARGGNLVIIGEPGRQKVMNEITQKLGVTFMDGCLVRPSTDFPADLIIAKATPEAAAISHYIKVLIQNNMGVSMPGATGLKYTTDKGFDVIPLLVTDATGSWNEVQTSDFIDQTATIDPTIGEVEQSYPTALALSRKMRDKEQKIVILGDADCFSNGELTRSRNNILAFNYALIQGCFSWLSDGEVPIDTRKIPTTDNDLSIGETGAKITKVLFIWVLSGSMFIFAIFIWLRRRGR